MKKLILMLLLGLSLVSCGDTPDETIAKASKAHEAGDYKTAFKLIEPLAEEGIAEAQYRLGVMYNRGTGVQQDAKQAADWFLKAADQGNVTAQYNLGVMYSQGRGVSQDFKEAIRWFLKSAEQGDASAQYNLGVIYFNGSGVPQDFAQSYMWFTVAASAGGVEATGNTQLLLDRITPAQIEEGKKMANDWIAKYRKSH